MTSSPSPSTDPYEPERLRGLLAAVQSLLCEMHAATVLRAAAITAVPADHRRSAENLVHYLTVRSHDLRPLQRELAALSLSSLGRMEGHALATMAGVERALRALLGDPRPAEGQAPHCGGGDAEDLLAQRSVQLLGGRNAARTARIMVTLPGADGCDPELLRRLLLAGMDLVRINLAHDDEPTWSAMVAALREAERRAARRCRVFVDLPGPKLRTGDVAPGPRVVRVRPSRDEFGRTVAPAEVVFFAPEREPPAGTVAMPLRTAPPVPVAVGDELERRGRADMGIVLKIETRLAFERLPELLLAGLRSPPLGVMVARGDLAAEVGFGRLAEVQEEILWLCEAAHVPVIWATQVLDSMARTGTPSRAEVTDAGMGVRAECVMLNKGPYVVETVAFLAGVLERMQAHHAKKSSLLRGLRVATQPRPEQGAAHQA